MNTEENRITVRPTKDDFIKYINDTLSSKGFNKESDKESWILERDIQMPGQTVIINNQRRDIPGQTKHLKFKISIFGEGYAEDIKTSRQDPFLEVDFVMVEGEDEIRDWPVFCLYYDEQMEFNKILSSIFRI